MLLVQNNINQKYSQDSLVLINISVYLGFTEIHLIYY